MIRLCSKCKKRPAVVFITRSESGENKSEGYCISCARELGVAPMDDMLKNLNISEDEFNAMSDQMMHMLGGEEGLAEMESEFPDDMDGMYDEDGFNMGGAQTFPFLKNLFGGDKKASETDNETSDEKQGKAKKRGEKNRKRKYLDAYCTNLTARAKKGELDNIIGRDRELFRVIQILSRRSKNNPCLIGEPGVGKTAIAEGLALRIVSGNVPARLSDKEVHLLDLTSLVAGTQFRGQFEARVKGLVDEVRREGNIILFIDEIHNIVGTGDAEGTMNAANILKPALSRGEIQVIGATTFKEYRKYIEKDAALERRFQPVVIEEPSVEDTINVLTGIKCYYEQYHRVSVPDEIIRKAVTLSERYITDRFLPDKAIDLLDEACANANLRNKAVDELYIANKRLEQLKLDEEALEADVENIDYEKIANVKADMLQVTERIKQLEPQASDNSVTDEDVAKVIEIWTGIPAAKVKESDLKKLAELETRLKEHIVGQDEAVEAVSAAVRRSRVRISPRKRPASFIFVGPTGVGKTELVKVLANELFSTPETLIRLDMSEYMEKHAVSKIIGAPPGYVGYDEAGQLTEKVRRKPYSVLLFDEIEKAHPDVLNILLQILDDGRITDAQGRTVNFENTIIVMTSNAGSDKKGGSLGFGKTTDDITREKVMKALEAFLRPEFIGRVDEIVIFHQLTEEDFERIAALMLDEIVPVLGEKGITLKYNKQACKLIAQKGNKGVRGARELRRIIRKEVEDKIASILIDRCDDIISQINISKSGDNLTVEAK